MSEYWVLENHNLDREGLTSGDVAPHGPFTSISAAESCIREDVLEYYEPSEMGDVEKYSGLYIIVEVVKRVQPVVRVSAKVILKDSK